LIFSGQNLLKNEKRTKKLQFLTIKISHKSFLKNAVFNLCVLVSQVDEVGVGVDNDNWGWKRLKLCPIDQPVFVKLVQVWNP
jgi:hypothetical protein